MASYVPSQESNKEPEYLTYKNMWRKEINTKHLH